MRIGHGLDVHRLVPGRRLVLGCVPIPYEMGLEAHSDGDAVVHALCDALLGAAGLGDIGAYFPNTPEFKDAAGRELLRRVIGMLGERRWSVVNADVTVVAQAPRLAPHIADMRTALAKVMQLSPDVVNVKATTTDRLGFTGRGEGIAVYAVCLLEPAAA